MRNSSYILEEPIDCEWSAELGEGTYYQEDSHCKELPAENPQESEYDVALFSRNENVEMLPVH